MTLFHPAFNCQTPSKGVKRLKTQADEGLTPADEAGSVVLRQPPASKLANLFRIDVRDHALGLVTQQLGGHVTDAPAGWVAWATNAITEGRARFRIGTQWFSRSGCWNRRTTARPCGRGKLAQFSLLQRFADWWVAPSWPILSVAAVLLALCRLVDKNQGFYRTRINTGIMSLVSTSPNLGVPVRTG